MSDPSQPLDPPPFSNSAPPPPPPTGATPPPPTAPTPPPFGPTAFPSAPPPPPTFPAAAPGGQVPVARVTGLAKALRALFWVAAAVSVLPVLGAINRRSAWKDFVDGSGSFDDLDSADNALVAMAGLLVVVQIAVLVVLCVWSIRAARNTNNLWRAGTSPGLAGGGWFIPFANFVIPFIQLRRAFRAAGLAAAAVSIWQGVLIAQVVVNAIGRSVGDLDLADSPSDVSGRLDAQVVWFLLSAAFTVAAAFFASRTVMQLSQAEEAAEGARI
jgi:hypothetical protein